MQRCVNMDRDVIEICSNVYTNSEQQSHLLFRWKTLHRSGFLMSLFTRESKGKLQQHHPNVRLCLCERDTLARVSDSDCVCLWVCVNVTVNNIPPSVCLSDSVRETHSVLCPTLTVCVSGCVWTLNNIAPSVCVSVRLTVSWVWLVTGLWVWDKTTRTVLWVCVGLYWCVCDKRCQCLSLYKRPRGFFYKHQGVDIKTCLIIHSFL